MKARVGYRLSEHRRDESWADYDKRRRASGLYAEATFPDQLFVNERIAPAAEALLRRKTDDAVAVYRVLDGEIVLTDIEIAGESILSCVRKAR